MTNIILEMWTGVPSKENIIIGRILLAIIGTIIGVWWAKNPASFWKYFKYLLLFWLILNAINFFDKDKDKE